MGRKLPPPIRPPAACPRRRSLADLAQPAPPNRALRRARRRLLRRLPVALLAALLVVAEPVGPGAQTGVLGFGTSATSDEPVTFTAEEVEFDQNADTVYARGRVEAWQGLRVLRADEFRYNRTTGVATATGNVVLIEPDGQVLFAERAELTGGMRDAALEGLRGLLAANARVAATGARRTDGRITDLARVVYSPCNLCPDDPERPPLWQLRARIASLHSDEQRVRYRGASLDFLGLPVLYTPYLSHAAPGAPRASGFLSPTLGVTRLLGGFWEQPYYWAIDDSSDLTITGTAATRQTGDLGVLYRQRFNSGLLVLQGSVGQLGSDDVDKPGTGWSVFSSGQFSLDENWRAGFALNRASSRDYLRAYRYGAPQTLVSNAYLEGFWGVEGYARADTRLYQNILQRSGAGQSPFVLPYGYAEWVFPPDELGGRISLDAQAYSLLRDTGADTRRVGTGLGYELPLLGSFGEIWTLRSRADLLTGQVENFNQTPVFGPGQDGSWTNGNLRAAVDWRLPLVRPAGEWGSQILEPRVQLVTGPGTGRQLDIPPEDSLDLEFSDANLFALNRFPGRDRQEGGTRVDAAMRAAWLFPNGGQVEGLVGRSFRASTEALFPVGSGLERRASDWVARARLAPVPWFEVLGRTRLDGESGAARLWDVSGTVFAGRFSVTAGYLGTDPDPTGTFRKREEISGGGLLRLTDNWRLGAFGRYDRVLERPVAAQAALTYEDECFIFETRLVRRWAVDEVTASESTNGTALLFRVTLKTIGRFRDPRPVTRRACGPPIGAPERGRRRARRGAPFPSAPGAPRRSAMRPLARALLLATALAAGGLALPAAPCAQEANRIVAVVNGDIVTRADIEGRRRLFAINAGLPASPQVLDRLTPQVTRLLVDERLRLQEVQRRRVAVGDDDIAAAVAELERRNGLPAGGLVAQLRRAGVEPRVLYDQLRVQIGWSRLVRALLGPQATPGEAEIADYIATQRARTGQPEFLVSEIFIPVDDPGEEPEVRRFVDDIIAQLRAGVPFPVAATQFSQAQTALQGRRPRLGRAGGARPRGRPHRHPDAARRHQQRDPRARRLPDRDAPLAPRGRARRGDDPQHAAGLLPVQLPAEPRRADAAADPAAGARPRADRRRPHLRGGGGRGAVDRQRPPGRSGPGPAGRAEPAAASRPDRIAAAAARQPADHRPGRHCHRHGLHAGAPQRGRGDAGGRAHADRARPRRAAVPPDPARPAPPRADRDAELSGGRTR
jgi:LPS-assembly protein